ncbi:MAG: rRNA maturation RNase YbeY [Lepagella sp.]
MIIFNCQNVDLPSLDFDRVRRWISLVTSNHSCSVGRLSYIFCDDDYILDVNRKFLQHDYYTDIITFDYTSRSRVAGDLVISLDTVKTNAVINNQPYERELHRVIIHGILHLCGINDKGPGEREIMEKEEDQALAILDSLE